MQSAFLLAFFLTDALWVATPLCAHPGSGIVFDPGGQIYFVHTGVGVFTVDREGRAVRYAEQGFHFMTLDPGGRFAEQRWPRFPDGEIHSVGTSPKLLLASSFPLAIGPDGALYYPEAATDGHVHMMRLEPRGEPTSLAVLPIAMEVGPDGEPVAARWIHGLAAASDGTLYYAEKHSVRRITQDGAISLVADDIHVPDCLRPPAASDERLGPVLRGLAVADDGTVYVAASGCSAVLRISPDGAVSVALRSTDAWSPTGVALAGDDLYVLEFRHIEVERAEDWLPRVRKVSPDGTVTIITTVTSPP